MTDGTINEWHISMGSRVGMCEFGSSQRAYSTVTDLARLRGWSTSVPLARAA